MQLEVLLELLAVSVFELYHVHSNFSIATWNIKSGLYNDDEVL